MADQLATVSKKRLRSLIGTLDSPDLDRVSYAIRLQLALP